jgi:HlyD family secretion protein
VDFNVMLVSEPSTLRLIVNTEKESRDSQTAAKPPKGPSFQRVLMIAIACVAAAIAVSVIWRYQRAQALPQFQLARVEKGVIESRVSATGTCNAVVSVQVGSQVSGNIKALYADFNTAVKAGQLVALIDPQMFQAKVEQAEAGWRNMIASLENARANATKVQADLSGAKAAEASRAAATAKAKTAVADAKAKLVRRVQMFQDQILSKEDLDTANTTYDQAIADLNAAEAEHDAAVHAVQSAEAALKAARTQIAMYQAQVALNLATLHQARIDLTNTRITSPVDGVVVARQMDVGQTVAASFQAPTIFQIAQDLTKMQIDTNVDEADVGRLKVGQPATFTVDAYPGTVFKGPIVQIRKAAINVQNVITYDAVIEAHNPDLKLFPGMTANVSILIEHRENARKIANAALRFRPAESLLATGSEAAKLAKGNWRTVYVPGKEAKARAVRLKAGISDGTYTEVEQGNLQPGDPVIIGVKPKGPATATPAPSITRRF